MEIVDPDPAAVETFWAEYAAATAAGEKPADVCVFGDSAEMADELADLVLAGTKRATAGAVREYAEEGWTPYVGALSVICRGDGTPVAVMRTIELRTGRLFSVDEAFAWDEGEGDQTRDGWIDGHQAYFARSFAARGWEVHEDPEVVFERFVVVWPAPPGRDEVPA